jgi:hypothetical protein
MMKVKQYLSQDTPILEEWQAAGEMALADVEDEHLCEY